MIDLTNYEEYLMLRLDGELLPAEEVELESFLALHPELAGEVAAYAATVLLPEEDPIFEGKETLYKSVVRPFYTRPVMWAAAAVLLIAIGIKLAPEESLPAVAVVPKKEIAAPVQPVAPPAQIASGAVPPAVNAPAVNAPVQKIAVVKNKQSQQLAIKGMPFQKEKVTPVEMSFGIALLEARSDRALPVEKVLPAEAQLQLIEVMEIAAVTPEKSPRLALQLPILNSIKEAAKEALPNIQFAGENLRGSQTTVMVFDRKLFTIRF